MSRNYSSPSGGAPPPYSDDADGADATDEKAPIETPAALASRAVPAISSAAKETLDDVKAKVSSTSAQLSSSADAGLRQRSVKTESVAEKHPAAVAQPVKQSADGVPVQLVALLCLLSFLLAYFFF